MGAKEAECRVPEAPKSGTVITNSRSRGHRARARVSAHRLPFPSPLIESGGGERDTAGNGGLE